MSPRFEVMPKSTLQKSVSTQKLYFFVQKIKKAPSNFFDILKSGVSKPERMKKLFLHGLQKMGIMKKLSKYGLKALKSTLNIQKSSQKRSKALRLCPANKQIQIFRVLFQDKWHNPDTFSLSHLLNFIV